jgi:hypothetical protein
LQERRNLSSARWLRITSVLWRDSAGVVPHWVHWDKKAVLSKYFEDEWISLLKNKIKPLNETTLLQCRNPSPM